MATPRLIQDFRRFNPNDKRSDSRLILDLGKAMQRKGASSGDSAFDLQFNTLRDNELPGLTEQIATRAGSGLRQLGGTALGPVALGLRAVGADEAARGVAETVASIEEEVAFRNRGLQTDFTTIGSPRQFLSAFAGGAAEVFPNVLESFITAGAGAVIGTSASPLGTAGGAVAGFFGKNYVKRQITKRLRKEFSEELGDKAIREIAEGAVKRGAGREAFEDVVNQLVARNFKEKAVKRALGNNASAWATKFVIGDSVWQNTGEIFNNITREGFDDDRRFQQIGSALGGGILAGALDSILPAVIINKAFGGIGRRIAIRETAKDLGKAMGGEEAAMTFLRSARKNLLKLRDQVTTKGSLGRGFIRRLPRDAAIEGLTEVAQTMIGETAHRLADPTYEIDPLTYKRDLINSGILGALGGSQATVVGTLTEAAQSTKTNRAISDAIADQRIDLRRVEDADVVMGDAFAKLTEMQKLGTLQKLRDNTLSPEERETVTGLLDALGVKYIPKGQQVGEVLEDGTVLTEEMVFATKDGGNIISVKTDSRGITRVTLDTQTAPDRKGKTKNRTVIVEAPSEREGGRVRLGQVYDVGLPLTPIDFIDETSEATPEEYTVAQVTQILGRGRVLVTTRDMTREEAEAKKLQLEGANETLKELGGTQEEVPAIPESLGSRTDESIVLDENSETFGSDLSALLDQVEEGISQFTESEIDSFEESAKALREVFSRDVDEDITQAMRAAMAEHNEIFGNRREGRLNFAKALLDEESNQNPEARSFNDHLKRLLEILKTSDDAEVVAAARAELIAAGFEERSLNSLRRPNELDELVKRKDAAAEQAQELPTELKGEIKHKHNDVEKIIDFDNDVDRAIWLSKHGKKKQVGIATEWLRRTLELPRSTTDARAANMLLEVNELIDNAPRDQDTVVVGREDPEGERLRREQEAADQAVEDAKQQERDTKAEQDQDRRDARANTQEKREMVNKIRRGEVAGIDLTKVSPTVASLVESINQAKDEAALNKALAEATRDSMIAANTVLYSDGLNTDGEVSEVRTRFIEKILEERKKPTAKPDPVFFDEDGNPANPLEMVGPDFYYIQTSNMATGQPDLIDFIKEGNRANPSARLEIQEERQRKFQEQIAEITEKTKDALAGSRTDQIEYAEELGIEDAASLTDVELKKFIKEFSAKAKLRADVESRRGAEAENTNISRTAMVLRNRNGGIHVVAVRILRSKQKGKTRVLIMVDDPTLVNTPIDKRGTKQAVNYDTIKSQYDLVGFVKWGNETPPFRRLNEEMTEAQLGEFTSGKEVADVEERRSAVEIGATLDESVQAIAIEDRTIGENEDTLNDARTILGLHNLKVQKTEIINQLNEALSDTATAQAGVDATRDIADVTVQQYFEIEDEQTRQDLVSQMTDQFPETARLIQIGIQLHDESDPDTIQQLNGERQAILRVGEQDVVNDLEARLIEIDKSIVDATLEVNQIDSINRNKIQEAIGAIQNRKSGSLITQLPIDNELVGGLLLTDDEVLRREEEEEAEHDETAIRFFAVTDEQISLLWDTIQRLGSVPETATELMTAISEEDKRINQDLEEGESKVNNAKLLNDIVVNNAVLVDNNIALNGTTNANVPLVVRNGELVPFDELFINVIKEANQDVTDETIFRERVRQIFRGDPITATTGDIGVGLRDDTTQEEGDEPTPTIPTTEAERDQRGVAGREPRRPDQVTARDRAGRAINTDSPTTFRDWQWLRDNDFDKFVQKANDSERESLVLRWREFSDRLRLVFNNPLIRDPRVLDGIRRKINEFQDLPVDQGMVAITDFIRQIQPEAFPDPLSVLTRNFNLSSEWQAVFGGLLSDLSVMSAGLSDMLQIVVEDDAVGRAAFFTAPDGRYELDKYSPGEMHFSKESIANLSAEYQRAGFNISQEQLLLNLFIHEAGHFAEAAVLGHEKTRRMWSKITMEGKAKVWKEYNIAETVTINGKDVKVRTLSTERIIKDILQSDERTEQELDKLDQMLRREWVAFHFFKIAEADGNIERALDNAIADGLSVQETTGLLATLRSMWQAFVKAFRQALTLDELSSVEGPRRERLTVETELATQSQELDALIRKSFKAAQDIGAQRLINKSSTKKGEIQRVKNEIKRTVELSNRLKKEASFNDTTRDVQSLDPHNIHKDRYKATTFKHELVPNVDILPSEDITLPWKLSYIPDKEGNTIEYVTDGQFTGAIRPDPDQRLGINLAIDRYINGFNGFYLADGAGVGKTVQQLIMASEIAERSGKRALIVSKESVIYDSFATDAQKLGMKFMPNIKDSTSEEQLRAAYQMLIGEVPEGMSKSGMKKAVKKYIAENKDSFNTIILSYDDLDRKAVTEQWGVSIFDEAQEAKNIESSRSKRVFGISSEFKIFSTATLTDKPQASIMFVSSITGKRKDNETQEEERERIANVADELGYEIRRKITFTNLAKGLELNRKQLKVLLKERVGVNMTDTASAGITEVVARRFLESLIDTQPDLAAINKELGIVDERLEPFVDKDHDDLVFESKTQIRQKLSDRGFGIIRNIEDARDALISEGALIRREYPYYGTITNIEFNFSPTKQSEWDNIISYHHNLLLKAGKTEDQIKNSKYSFNDQRKWLEIQKEEEIMRLIRERLQGKGVDPDGNPIPPGKIVVMADTVNRQYIEAFNGGTQEFVQAQLDQHGKLKKQGMSDNQIADRMNVPVERVQELDSMNGELQFLAGLLQRLESKLKAEGIPFSTLTAESKDKAANINNFQEGSALVMLTSPQSGAVGVNFDDKVGDAPRTLIMATLPEAGEIFEQALGRVSRRTSQTLADTVLLASKYAGEVRRGNILANKLKVVTASSGGVAAQLLPKMETPATKEIQALEIGDSPKDSDGIQYLNGGTHSIDPRTGRTNRPELLLDSPKAIEMASRLGQAQVLDRRRLLEHGIKHDRITSNQTTIYFPEIASDTIEEAERQGIDNFAQALGVKQHRFREEKLFRQITDLNGYLREVGRDEVKNNSPGPDTPLININDKFLTGSKLHPSEWRAAGVTPEGFKKFSQYFEIADPEDPTVVYRVVDNPLTYNPESAALTEEAGFDSYIKSMMLLNSLGTAVEITGIDTIERGRQAESHTLLVKTRRHTPIDIDALVDLDPINANTESVIFITGKQFNDVLDNAPDGIGTRTEQRFQDSDVVVSIDGQFYAVGFPEFEAVEEGHQVVDLILSKSMVRALMNVPQREAHDALLDDIQAMSFQRATEGKLPSAVATGVFPSTDILPQPVIRLQDFNTDQDREYFELTQTDPEAAQVMLDKVAEDEGFVKQWIGRKRNPRLRRSFSPQRTNAAIWLTPSEDFADTFAGETGFTGQMYVSTSNIWDFQNKEHVEALARKELEKGVDGAAANFEDTKRNFIQELGSFIGKESENLNATDRNTLRRIVVRQTDVDLNAMNSQEIEDIIEETLDAHEQEIARLDELVDPFNVDDIDVLDGLQGELLQAQIAASRAQRLLRTRNQVNLAEAKTSISEESVKKLSNSIQTQLETVETPGSSRNNWHQIESMYSTTIKELGYDGYYEREAMNREEQEFVPTKNIALFNAEVVKSTDLITTRIDGTAVPLSERFQRVNDVAFARQQGPLQDATDDAVEMEALSLTEITRNQTTNYVNESRPFENGFTLWSMIAEDMERLHKFVISEHGYEGSKDDFLKDWTLAMRNARKQNLHTPEEVIEELKGAEVPFEQMSSIDEVTGEDQRHQILTQYTVMTNRSWIHVLNKLEDARNNIANDEATLADLEKREALLTGDETNALEQEKRAKDQIKKLIADLRASAKANGMGVRSIGDGMSLLIWELDNNRQVTERVQKRIARQATDFLNRVSKDRLLLFDILDSINTEGIDPQQSMDQFRNALANSSNATLKSISTREAEVITLAALARSDAELFIALKLRKLPKLRTAVKEALARVDVEIAVEQEVAREIAKTTNSTVKNARLIGKIQSERSRVKRARKAVEKRVERERVAIKIGDTLANQYDKLQQNAWLTFGGTIRANHYSGVLQFLPPSPTATREEILKTAKPFNYLSSTDVNWRVQKKQQDDWLEHNNFENRDRDPFLWNQVKEQNNRITKAAFDHTLYNVKTFAPWFYASLSKRAQSVGLPQTRAMQRMITHMQAHIDAMSNEAKRAGLMSQDARDSLIRAIDVGMTGEEFVKLIDTPTKRFIEQADATPKQAWDSVLIANPAKAKMLKGHFKLFETYIKAEAESFRMFKEFAERLGLKVTDDRIWIPDFTLDPRVVAKDIVDSKDRKGVVDIANSDLKLARIAGRDVILTPIERVHFNIGTEGTFQIKSDMDYLDRMRNAMSLVKDDDDWNVRVGEVMERLKDADDQDIGEILIDLDRHFQGDVVELFLLPLIKMTKQTAFAGTTQSEAVDAFERSDGTPSNFLQILWDDVKSKTSLQKFDRKTWMMETMRTFQTYYNSFMSDYNTANPAQDHASGLHNAPRTSLDARKRTSYPAEWVEYRMAGLSQNVAWLGHLAFNAAMGKDGDNFFKANADAIKTLETLRSDLENVRRKNIGKSDKQVKQIAADKLGGKAEVAIAEKADTHIAELKSLENDFRNIFSSELGPFKDLGTLSEAMTTMVLGTLNGPRSAITQFNDIYLSAGRMGGLNRESIAFIAQRSAATLQGMWGSLMGAIGVEFAQNDQYRVLARDIQGIEHTVGISFLDQMNSLIKDMGFEEALRAGNEEAIRASNSQFERLMQKAGFGQNKIKKALRVINQSFSKGVSRVDADKALFETFNPWSPFNWSIKHLNRSLIMIGAKRMDRLAMQATQYLKRNQNNTKVFIDGDIKKGLNPEFQFSDVKSELGYKELKIAGIAIYNETEAFDYYTFNVLQERVGVTLEQVALDNFNQKEGRHIDSTSGKALPYTLEQYQLLTSVIANDMAGDANQLTTRTAKAGVTEKLALPLLGWTMNRAGDFAEIFKTKNHEFTMESAITGIMTTAIGLLPAVLAFSLFRDWFDEWVMGKKSNLKPISSDDWVVNIVERFTREGTMGMTGELLNLMVNTAAGEGGDVRTLSLDQRIFLANSIRNIISTFGTIRNQQGTVTYSTAIRPIIQNTGGNGALQWMQLMGNTLGWENPETRHNARSNVSNWLKSSGFLAGLEPRAFSGTTRATPMTPWVTEMALSAYQNDALSFEEARLKAVEAAMEFHDETAEEATARIAKSFNSRHPLKTAFRLAPSVDEVTILLQRMPDSGSSIVQESVFLYNKFNQKLGNREYLGSVPRGSTRTSRPTFSSIISGANKL